MKADYLLERGMEVLWSKGYNGTSVNDIVQAADVPKGSFYFYFESKEDFTVKAINQYFEDVMLPGLEILKDLSMTAKERLIALYEYKIKKMRASGKCRTGCMACNIGSEMAEHSEKIRMAIANNEEVMRSKLVEVVEEAQKDGDITNSLPARDLVKFIEDAGKGAMMSMKLTQSMDRLENVFRMIKDVLLK